MFLPWVYGGVNCLQRRGTLNLTHTLYPWRQRFETRFLGEELLRGGPDFVPLDAGGVHLERAVPVRKDHDLHLLAPLTEQLDRRLLDAEVYGVEPQWRGRLVGAGGREPRL